MVPLCRRAVVLCIASLAVALTFPTHAGAQGTPPADLGTAPATTNPTLPPQPAMPAGCAAPTVAQCTDGNFYKTDACAKDPAKTKAVQAVCTWMVQKAWFDMPVKHGPSMFPGSAPNTPYPLITPGKRMDLSKNASPKKSTRPAERRRFTGQQPTTQARAAAAAPPIAKFTPRTVRAGGSYAGMRVAPVVAQLEQVDTLLEAFRRQPQATLRSDPGLLAKAAQLNGLLAQAPPWVSPGNSVSSCEEYGFKRWGDYSKFAFAARKLGSHYRQIYNLAMDPQSNLFFNKPQLLQVGGASTPKQIVDKVKIGHTEPYLPANVFVSAKPDWLTSPKATVSAAGKPLITDAQKAQVWALWNAQQLPLYGIARRVTAKTDRSPLGLHREMKQLFDTKYGDPLDGELADMSHREGIYADLVSQRATLKIELICAHPQDPCNRCGTHDFDQATQSLPAGLQRVREKITGMTVINPADMKDGFRGGSRLDRASSLSRITSTAAALEQIGGGASGLTAPQLGGATGGAKQKTAPLNAQVRGANPRIQSCAAAQAAKAPQIEAALLETERLLTRHVVNELAYGDRGCFADPKGAIGNLCDWSYEDFANQVSDLFDVEVDRDVKDCRARIAKNLAAKTLGAARALGSGLSGFSQIVKEPAAQRFVFPCTQRRDFSGSAVDVRRFIELDTGEFHGRMCEALRQNDAITQQQAAVAPDLLGIQWQPPDGKLFDKEEDTLVLGDKGSLGAYFAYDIGWDMYKTAVKDNDPMLACKFQGSAKNDISAGIYFFGDDLQLFKVAGAGEARPAGGGTLDVSYLDIDTFKTKYFDTTTRQWREAPGTKSVPLSPDAPYSVALADPPVLLGGVEYSFWVEIGPIPVKITFGASAKAGIDYQLEATPGDNCANLAKTSGFRLVSQVKPWVRADAFAEASIDVLIASAGVRLDLNLLYVSIPVGVAVGTAKDGKYSFHNGASIGIDMLSGTLSGFVSVGVPPIEGTFEAEIFGWNGFHTSIPVFGIDKRVNQDVVRIAMAGRVDLFGVQCKCGPDFCCSNLSCLANASPVVQAMCATQAKPIDGKPYICTFSQADQSRLVAKNASTESKSCQVYVK